MSQVVCLNLSLLHSGTYLQAGNAKPLNWLSKISWELISKRISLLPTRTPQKVEFNTIIWTNIAIVTS